MVRAAMEKALKSGLALAVALTAFGVSSSAHAQHYEEAMIPRQSSLGSPEFFALELRGGPYSPNSDPVAMLYPDDSGPMLAVEFDVMFLRIPYVGRVGVGMGLGWARLTDKALDATTMMRTDEEIVLTVIDIPVMGVLRIDALSRELDIPLLLTGKLGVDFVLWDEDKGETQSGSGLGIGLRWGVNAALELDFFDRAAARSLDEEWGINHTYLFFEYWGSTAEDDFALGDQTWSIGLGFLF